MSWYSTTMYHILYLTFALSIILNNCALNRANVADVDLSDNEYTWLDGEKYCRARAPNGQMLSHATYLSDMNPENMPSTNYSFWVRSVRIDEQIMEKYIKTNAAVDESLKGVLCLYHGKFNACGSDGVIQITQPTDIYNAIGQPGDDKLRVSYINYSSLFQADASDGHNSTILCYMITKEGVIATDDCNTTKRVACINGTFINYIDLVEKDNITTTTALGTTSTTVEGTSTTSYVQNNTTEHVLGNTTTDTTTPSRATTPAEPVMSEVIYAIIAVSIVVVIVFICVIVCCCTSRRSKKKKTKSDIQLSPVYSDAFDSLAMKDSDRAAPEDVEYATPEDALPQRHALPRHSIGENEYDSVISKKQELPKTGNIYSHVAIQTNKGGVNVNNVHVEVESEYDVSSYSKSKMAAEVQRKGNDLESGQGNIYGHLQS